MAQTKEQKQEYWKSYNKNLPPSVREKYRHQDKLRKRELRKNMTPEQIQKRDENSAIYRANRSPEQKEILKRNNKNWNLLKSYGITHEQFDIMLEEQGYKCGNKRCSTELDGGKNTNVDHDHSYPKGDPRAVLSLLCSDCNWARGTMENDVERMRGLWEYQMSIDEKVQNFSKVV